MTLLLRQGANESVVNLMVPNGPASGILEIGDRIVGVEGQTQLVNAVLGGFHPPWQSKTIGSNSPKAATPSKAETPIASDCKNGIVSRYPSERHIGVPAGSKYARKSPTWTVMVRSQWDRPAAKATQRRRLVPSTDLAIAVCWSPLPAIESQPTDAQGEQRDRARFGGKRPAWVERDTNRITTRQRA